MPIRLVGDLDIAEEEGSRGQAGAAARVRLGG
jgi:hypothetical protein